jgi:site-specific DNA-methyltransferase (adenine-specific)
MHRIITEKPKIEIIHGDCLDILATFEPDSFDAVIADPPYSSGGVNTVARQASVRSKYSKHCSASAPPGFVGDNRDQRSWMAWCAMWLRACLAAVKTGGTAMVFSDWRQTPTLSDALQAAGWTWKRLFVWDKKNAIPARSGMFRQSCEFVLIGQKGSNKTRATPDGGWISPMGLCSCASPNITGARLHLTQKPVELLKYLMQIIPREGRVLDPFMGSGSTLAAAFELGMDAVGIEIDEGYARLAIERIEGMRVDGEPT